MTDFLLLILGLVLLQLLIILHEYGHLIVAKRNGVEVKEFGLGFPPRLCGRTLGRGIFRCYYSLNLLPLGGFVRLKGENDAARGPGTYGGCNLAAKARITMAGAAANLAIAGLLFTLLALVGIPRLLPVPGHFSEDQFSLAADTQIVQHRVLVSQLEEGSPAEAAGLEPGDQILLMTDSASRQEHTLDAAASLVGLTERLAGRPIEITIIRDRQQQVLTAQLRTTEEAEADGRGHLGIATVDFILQRNTWSAPLTGAGLVLQYTKLTLQELGRAIGSLFRGDVVQATETATSPVGIFFILKAVARQGYQSVLMIIALISLTLAIVNSLPIPALDGGRLTMSFFFAKILRRPLTKRLEARLINFSAIVLLPLVLLLMLVDIDRFLLNG